MPQFSSQTCWGGACQNLWLARQGPPAVRPHGAKAALTSAMHMKRTVLAFIALLAATHWLSAVPAHATDRLVDLELVIAVDVSFSISRGEQDIQRRGYANAFVSQELVEAVTSGHHGRIAVIYFEWAGPGSQYKVVPWTVIDGASAAWAFAKRLREAPIRRGGETSISQALITASGFFPYSTSHLARRVIDISGDGPNNSGS